MTPAEITAALRAEARAKFDAALGEVERRTAHLPDDVREAILAEARAKFDAHLAQLEREWAAFELLLATGQLPLDGPWRPAIDLAATPREPGEPLQ